MLNKNLFFVFLNTKNNITDITSKLIILFYFRQQLLCWAEEIPKVSCEAQDARTVYCQ